MSQIVFPHMRQLRTLTLWVSQTIPPTIIFSFLRWILQPIPQPLLITQSHKILIINSTQIGRHSHSIHFFFTLTPTMVKIRTVNVIRLIHISLVARLSYLFHVVYQLWLVLVRLLDIFCKNIVFFLIWKLYWVYYIHY